MLTFTYSMARMFWYFLLLLDIYSLVGVSVATDVSVFMIYISFLKFPVTKTLIDFFFFFKFCFKSCSPFSNLKYINFVIYLPFEYPLR